MHIAYGSCVYILQLSMMIHIIATDTVALIHSFIHSRLAEPCNKSTDHRTEFVCSTRNVDNIPKFNAIYGFLLLYDLCFLRVLFRLNVSLFKIRHFCSLFFSASNSLWCHECVNTPKYRSLVYVPANSRTKKMCSKCEETNRQTRKRVEVFCFVFLILFSTFIPCQHRRLLLAAFFLRSRADVRHSITAQRIFQNQWMTSIVQFQSGNDSLALIFRLLRTSYQFTLLYFIHSFIAGGFFVLIIASRRYKTCADRSAFFLASFC